MNIELPATLNAVYHEDGVWDPEAVDRTNVPSVEIRFGYAPVAVIEITDLDLADRLLYEKENGDHYDLNEYVADWLRHLWTMGANR